MAAPCRPAPAGAPARLGYRLQTALGGAAGQWGRWLYRPLAPRFQESLPRGPSAPLIRLPGIPRPHPLVGCSLESASLRTPEDDLLDLPSELEILVGNSPRGMILELDDDATPGDGQIGMMVGGLRQIGDGVHQHSSGGPAIGLVDSADPPILVVPTRQFLEPLVYFAVVVGAFFRCWHGFSLLLHHHSTVHHDHLAGQKGRGVRRQKDCRSGHIIRLAPTAQWRHLDHFLTEFRIGVLAKGGFDESWR